jgi:hypothetical protein
MVQNLLWGTQKSRRTGGLTDTQQDRQVGKLAIKDITDTSTNKYHLVTEVTYNLEKKIFPKNIASTNGTC